MPSCLAKQDQSAINDRNVIDYPRWQESRKWSNRHGSLIPHSIPWTKCPSSKKDSPTLTISKWSIIIHMQHVFSGMVYCHAFHNNIKWKQIDLHKWTTVYWWMLDLFHTEHTLLLWESLPRSMGPSSQVKPIIRKQFYNKSKYNGPIAFPFLSVSCYERGHQT